MQLRSWLNLKQDLCDGLGKILWLSFDEVKVVYPFLHVIKLLKG